MKTIRIAFDFTAGPLWPEHYDAVTHTKSTGIEIIDNDEKLKEITHKIGDMYDLYYIIDEKEGVSFNYEQERRDRDKMLYLLGELNRRLEEINDGSFVVVDEETPRVKKLKPL